MKKWWLVITLIAVSAWGFSVAQQQAAPRTIDAIAQPLDWSKNQLAKAESCGGELPLGPEAIAVKDAGAEWHIFTGTENGDIYQIAVNKQTGDCDKAEKIVNTGGRPLGMVFSNHLFIADAEKGLLKLNNDRSLEVLVSHYQGEKLKFVDDVAADQSGNLYFTDVSEEFGYHNYKLDMLRGKPQGRVFKWHAATGKTELLMDNLYFANGITISPDNKFLLVNESLNHSVKRYWLSGEKTGSSDCFIKGLPGYPDNIRADKQSGYWLALMSPRTGFLDWAQQNTLLRKVALTLPLWMQPSGAKKGVIIKLSATGEIENMYTDKYGDGIYATTHGLRIGNYLYLGSLKTTAVKRLKLN